MRMSVLRSLLAATAIVFPLAAANAGVISGSDLVINQEIDNWFFTTTGTGTVTISVTDTVLDGSDFDSEINLYFWDGSLDFADFIENDDDDGGSLNSLINRTLDAGTYLLRVGTHNFDPADVGTTNPNGHHTGTDYTINISGDFVQPYETTDVPEPATLAVFGMGLLGLGLAGRRRKTS
jgi:hypothetical protein